MQENKSGCFFERSVCESRTRHSAVADKLRGSTCIQWCKHTYVGYYARFAFPYQILGYRCNVLPLRHETPFFYRTMLSIARTMRSSVCPS